MKRRGVIVECSCGQPATHITAGVYACERCDGMAWWPRGGMVVYDWQEDCPELRREGE